ncbi:hypothetical protein PENANT_c002G07356 [Penicillium antarcticum]|uniref:Uncharacterized protein n=1 Tax=Penicillium antarcticum TaxID=416450 RepID=A0A1V6QK83_9EURO|nr:hypothetical protein PENANT_c002G07356 [Penicillium antarcticum]
MCDVRAFESYGADYLVDHSFKVNLPSYTISRFVRHSPSGDDTLLTSKAKLFDAHSEALKQSLSGLTAVHSSEINFCPILFGGTFKSDLTVQCSKHMRYLLLLAALRKPLGQSTLW